MKSRLEANKRCMGYSTREGRLSGPRGAFCLLCAHARGEGKDLRCTKGGFYVIATGYCKEFAPTKQVTMGVDPAST